MDPHSLSFIARKQQFNLINMSAEDEPKTAPAAEGEEDAGEDVPVKEEESTATFEPVVSLFVSSSFPMM